MNDPRTLAIVREYDDLIAAVRARMDELQMTFDILDHRSGVQVGYSAKILGPTPSKRFGQVSLGCILGALRLKMILVDDPAAARAHRENNERKRITGSMLSAGGMEQYWPFVDRVKAGHAGRLARASQTPDQRRRIARKAARARWARSRVI